MLDLANEQFCTLEIDTSQIEEFLRGMEGTLEDSILVIKLLIQDNVIILNDKQDNKEFKLKAFIQ